MVHALQLFNQDNGLKLVSKQSATITSATNGEVTTSITPVHKDRCLVIPNGLEYSSPNGAYVKEAVYPTTLVSDEYTEVARNVSSGDSQVISMDILEVLNAKSIQYKLANSTVVNTTIDVSINAVNTDKSFIIDLGHVQSFASQYPRRIYFDSSTNVKIWAGVNSMSVYFAVVELY